MESVSSRANMRDLTWFALLLESAASTGKLEICEFARERGMIRDYDAAIRSATECDQIAVVARIREWCAKDRVPFNYAAVIESSIAYNCVAVANEAANWYELDETPYFAIDVTRALCSIVLDARAFNLDLFAAVYVFALFRDKIVNAEAVIASARIAHNTEALAFFRRA